MAHHIAVLGAGPVGLEAALYALALGHHVIVYERGAVGQSVREWGFVRLFSPWALNRSPLGEAAVLEQGGGLSDGDAYPTGREYVSAYLEPLAAAIRARGGLIRTHTRVRQIGREGLLKNEAIGDPRRGEHAFRLLLEDPEGGERVAHADLVVDCTGTWGHPNRLGASGIAAPGERAVLASGRLHPRLVDVAGTERARFAGKRVLVVGAGYSAATALEALTDLADTTDTRVLWLTRGAGPPYARIPDDSLVGRDRVAALGNALAAGDHPRLEHVGDASVEALALENGGVCVRFGTSGGERVEHVDEILALVGFSPERSLHEELQIHECYASFGTMKLAAALLAAGGGGGDCLAQASPGPATLRSPEPGYFILGAKSYGRNSSFLIKLGLEQVRDVFTLVEGDAALDLYA